MANIDETIDKRNKKEAEQEQGLKRLMGEFLDFIKEKYQYTNDSTLQDYIKASDNMINSIFITSPQEYIEFLKFERYEKTKRLLFSSLDNFLFSIYQAKHNKKPEKVLDYELALEGLEKIELAINYCGDNEAEERTQNSWTEQANTDYEASKDFFKFKRYLLGCYFEEAITLSKEIEQDRQKAKENFNKKLMLVSDSYNLGAKTAFERGEIANKILKHFYPKDKTE